MLAALARPDEVERVVGVLHVERVAQLELGVGHAAFLRELRRAALLFGRYGDAGDVGLRELLGNVARGTANAAAHVEHRRRRVRLGKVEHLVDEVVLGLDEVFAAVEGAAALALGVVAQVDVLACAVRRKVCEKWTRLGV